jgi:hypothetical protein
MHGICASNNPSCAERLKMALFARSRAWPDFMPRCGFRKRPSLRSTRGRMPVQRLRAAHELSRISADIHTDRSLHLKTHTTNCED